MQPMGIVEDFLLPTLSFLLQSSLELANSSFKYLKFLMLYSKFILHIIVN